MPDVRFSPRADLRALSHNVLLARLRGLPRGNAEREAICEILMSRYAGLVQSCVRPYRQSPESAEDLLQVGYVGLLKAINNFDPRYGDSLNAFARPCISGEIKRHFRDRRWQIRVGRPAQELLLEMRAAEESLAQQLGAARTPGYRIEAYSAAWHRTAGAPGRSRLHRVPTRQPGHLGYRPVCPGSGHARLAAVRC